ncbi:MAG: MFS transporter [Actinomycetota bacterium]|nr:MFS transporter [Actinomycetota bacterium]
MSHLQGVGQRPVKESATGTRPDSGGMLQSWHEYPAFRLLLLGTFATNSAFWMYQVAVGWLALQMTDSPFFVGLAGFIGGIPLLVCSLPAGVIIDRYDRRSILLVAQVGAMAVSGLFALLVSIDQLAPWSLLVLVALYGTVMSFIFPTRTTMVPSLVRREDLANGVALNSAGQNATRVIGPSLAGVLIALLGVAQTFAIAAALQALALVATARLPSAIAETTVRGGTGLTGLTLGLRIVAKTPYLIALITLALVPTVLVMPYINLMPVFARDEYALGSFGLGVLLASIGLGTVAGSLSVAHSSRLRREPAAQVITATAFAFGVLLFAITTNVVVAALLLFGAGWMSAAFLALNQTALQLTVDEDVRGRVLSIYLLTWGMLPIGQLAVGGLANVIGTPLALACACAVALVGISIIAWGFPSLRRQDRRKPAVGTL